MSGTPSPRSQPASTLLPDRSIPSEPLDQPTKPPPSSPLQSFIPAWRRPASTSRRPSVQFVPQIKDASAPHSRSSSARPTTARIASSNLSTPSSTNNNRRMSSPPPPAQFRSSVSFDTFSNKAASDFSLTLNRKHRDYEYTKRSRTFLCGTDTNEYSDTALEWLIDELVDDGDEVVCLRVVEKDSRDAVKWSGGQGESGYRAEAARFLEGLEKKNTQDRAISLVLEFSIGKVHETIQQMIRIYEPAILVVGTRGRSLTGYQGLLTSGSVSKYCLQYSPVPVIVVRPSRKREAKKRKRMQDPERRGYRDILDKSEDAPRGRGGHLLDGREASTAELGLLGELGQAGDPDEEARKVAEAIGYRASGVGQGDTGARGSSLSRVTSASSARSYDEGPSPNERVLKSPEPRSPDDSDNEDDDPSEQYPEDDDEDIGRLQESLRPEDEAAMLAYERAQKLLREEEEEEEARLTRARERSERSASRGRGAYARAKEQEEEGTGQGVLGVLAQLDRGMK